MAMATAGLSGGFVVLWNRLWVWAKAFSYSVGILIEGHLHRYQGHIHILNLYGPYKNRMAFWDALFASGIMDLASLIIAGDFKYTVGLDEEWGMSRKIDPMVGMN